MSNLLFTEVSLAQQESVAGGCLQHKNKRRNNDRNKINIFNIFNINLITLLVMGNGNIVDISQFIKSKY
ncbi:MAG: hypothetical protein NTY89_08680 [Nostocales cyanobacterium LacPavin_0920_SED1_MAG_38_18]|jgi:hypothetical protein|uniref:hypothetical protein n=1 Tax=Anabaena sp. WA102 TaxID=1647413 RepID=UPI0006AC5ABD|nr:hypothetical protein [Anabaena sp. WA102]ALB41412.1 hypothetical protein AA650_13895 [Anabaena sp. WA102]MCX5981858.1 hypothetical protein [Nostocales cyanobacterium LacPavin_0920_SED1_MAG_38_18]